jgi:hypothetical protein
MNTITVPELPKRSDSFGFMVERQLLLDQLSSYVSASFMRRLSLFVPQGQWLDAVKQAGFVQEQAR